MFNSHLSEDHVKIFTIQTSGLQPVCSQEPVSPEIMPSLPQSTRQGLDFTNSHVRAGVNLCALALFTVQRVGTEGKTLLAIKYQLQEEAVPRLLRNVGTCA